MKRDYTLYQPGTLIRDFYEPTSTYYRASDVAWSPFTKIGALVSSPAQPEPLLRSSGGPSPVRTPVFPTGFSLGGIKASPDTRRVPVAPNAQRSVAQNNVAVMEWLAGLAGGLGTALRQNLTRHQLVPTKYTLSDGVQPDFSGRLAGFAKISFAALALSLVLLWGMLFTVTSPKPTSMPPHTKPGQSQVSNGASGLSTTASHTTTTPIAPTTQQSVTTTTPAPVVGRYYSVPSSTPTPVVGGYGGGPTTPVSTTPAVPTTPDPTTSQITPTTPVSPVTNPVTDPTSTSVSVGGTSVTVTPPVVAIP